MAKKTAFKNYIGTSGWSYTHWKENFYPPKLKSTEWLDYYAIQFPTVEINTTFYHTPLLTTIDKWYSKVPKDFMFSIKANRYITHQKRLNDCSKSLEIFFQNLTELKPKIGCILFQLPPSFKINLERLTEFIELLDKSYRYTFEFRHDSWYSNDVYEILTKNKIALCITDLSGKLSPEKITTDFTYIRLHGPKKAYSGSYGTTKLKWWKKKIEQWNSSNTSVYCYFDNDEKGFAIQDAKKLQEMFIKT